MKNKLGTGIGMAAGIIGLLIGGLMLIGRVAFEMEVETLLLGFVSTGIIGMLCLALSAIIIAGSLIANQRPALALLLIIVPSLAGLVIIGSGFALPAILGMAAGALFYFKKEHKAEPVD